MQERTIFCTQIVNGKTCGKSRQVKKMGAKKTLFCRECADERQRALSRAYYRKNRDRIIAGTLARRKKKARPNKNKSSKKPITVKCPTCHGIRPLKIHVANPEEYENGKVFWKRCDPCKQMIEGIDCPVEGAYGIGRQA